MMYLCCYDISDGKRLHKVAKKLEQVGLRCQKSIFLFKESSKVNFGMVLKDIQKYITAEDSFMAIPLSMDDYKKTITIGSMDSFNYLEKNYLIV